MNCSPYVNRETLVEMGILPAGYNKLGENGGYVFVPETVGEDIPKVIDDTIKEPYFGSPAGE